MNPCKHWFEGMVARSETSCPFCEIEELQTQLPKHDKTILEQQVIIKNLAGALDGYFTTEDFRQEVKEACAGIESALKAERIKTLENSANVCMDIYGGLPTNSFGQKQNTAMDCATELRRMANELKEQP